MAIHRLIAKGAFDPEDIKIMIEAYEQVLIDLALSDPRDPIRELTAKFTITIVASGERDPISVKDRVINALGIRPIDKR
ncbi:MAG TPA: hypothetical protein VHT68_22685 [Pseudolabrys sp.]|jgi:hypothetical protein|nr:hypothetical protein [Pseudolabrys sp.]